MILKLSLWVESKQFSQPEVEKEVMQDLLTSALKSLLSVKTKYLNDTGVIGTESQKKLVPLLKHLKEAEVQIINHKRVLEVMRTGLKDENL
jgi:hypothetical protein